jgi:hypothetical protein
VKILITIGAIAIGLLMLPSQAAEFFGALLLCATVGFLWLKEFDS